MVGIVLFMGARWTVAQLGEPVPGNFSEMSIEQVQDRKQKLERILQVPPQQHETCLRDVLTATQHKDSMTSQGPV